MCGKKYIALRDHREDIHNSSNNCGNFLATYISPRIQNELIEIISYDIVKKGLVEDVKEATFFSLMVDEVESQHTDQLSICLRFVD